MAGDPTYDDVVALMLAIIANNPGTLHGAAFTPVAADADRAGLEYHPNRARFDAAMWRMIEDGLVERDEAAEYRMSRTVSLPDYEYGRAFRITEYGRRILKDAGVGEQD